MHDVLDFLILNYVLQFFEIDPYLFQLVSEML